MELNKEQLGAVKHLSGPLLIIAGAGTGKTRAISERILDLIKSGKSGPGEILALTFSEKAAREMETRIDEGMPLSYEEICIKTFHGFADMVLREAGLEIGLDPGFKILSQVDQWFFFKKHLFEFPLDYYRPLGNPNKFIYDILDHFSKLKDELISPEQYLAYSEKLEDEDERVKLVEIAKTYQKYQELLIKNNYLDFGDLVYYTVTLFDKRENVLKKYQEKFKYIHVDEFQDTNYAQFQMVLRLAEAHKNIVVVGDDDQSIYKWRGASLSNILQFQKYFPEHKSIVLLENYRSSENILDAAYSLIQNNNPDRLEEKLGINKKLRCNVEMKAPVEVHHFPNFIQESAFVAEKIKELHEKEGIDYKDFAILVRSNQMAHPFIDELKYLGIPYQVKNPKGLFALDEIKDLIAVARFLANPKDDISLLRILKMDIFEIPMASILRILNAPEKDFLYNVIRKELTELTLIENEFKKAFDLLEALIEFSKKETIASVLVEFMRKAEYVEHLSTANKFEELDNINEFAKQVKKFEKENPENTVYDFVNYLNLLEESNSNFPVDEFEQRDSVQILTVHSSKGLEFKCVFIVNTVKERFPSRGRSNLFELPEELTKEIYPEGDVRMQEERRLFYVAVTRAKEHLFVSYSDKYEGNKNWKISPFVKEVLESKKAKNFDHEEMESAIKKLKENSQVNKSIFALPPFNKKKLSYSQIDTFKTCPLQYNYRYLMKVPTPPSHATSFGSSVHETLKEIYRTLQQRKNVDFEKVKEIYQKNWLPFGFESKEHENIRKEKGLEVLQNFYETNSAPWIIPAFIEKNFNLKIGDFWLMGRIDRIDKLPDGTYEVIDYKTGRIKSDTNQFKDLQLSIYSLVCRDLFKIKVSKLSLYFLEENQKLSCGPRKDEELDNLTTDILKSIEEMKKSDFAPTPGFQCNFCDFRLICPAV